MKKLRLSRETLRDLEPGKLGKAAGGQTPAPTFICPRSVNLPGCIPSYYCTPDV